MYPLVSGHEFHNMGFLVVDMGINRALNEAFLVILLAYFILMDLII